MKAWQLVADSMSHSQWLDQVIEWCHMGGWRVYVMHDSRAQHWSSDTGFPDVFAVRGKRQVAAELKVPGDRVRRQQRQWLDALAECGAESYVWWPRDADHVREVLLGGIPVQQLVMQGMILKSRQTRRGKIKRPASAQTPRASQPAQEESAPMQRQVDDSRNLADTAMVERGSQRGTQY